MMFVLTFLLVAGLEIAYADNNLNEKHLEKDSQEESDMCVGCDDKKDEKLKKEKNEQELTVEIRIDPATGKVLYVVKGVVIE